jgi:hypothetical protein
MFHRAKKIPVAEKEKKKKKEGEEEAEKKGEEVAEVKQEAKKRKGKEEKGGKEEKIEKDKKNKKVVIRDYFRILFEFELGSFLYLGETETIAILTRKHLSTSI